MTAHDNTMPIEIIERLSVIRPSSRDDLIKQAETVIGGFLIRKIDSHNTTSILLLFQNLEVSATLQTTYILKAEYGSGTATEKEIGWYLNCKEYDFIPKQIFSSVSETHSLLLMEYIEGAQTLDAMRDEDGHFSALAHYGNAIELDRKMYHESTPRKSTMGEMDRFYIDKFEQRLHESKQFDYLMQLFDTNTHIVNGRQYYSPRYYIDKINKNTTLRDYLMPHELGFIHGDLHGGNILVASNRVYLVDPNGNREMPLEYDFGKILHTVHGGYPAIMDGSYVLDRTDEEFIFELNTTDTELYPGIKKFLNDSELMRGLYTEAMHFATMLPHHADNRQETTALFLRTIELFDELYYDMSIK